jgi:hypothetical protein
MTVLPGIFPTIAAICHLSDDIFVRPIDGKSILPLFKGKADALRKVPIPFKYRNQGAFIDNDFKLLVENIEKKEYALYDLKNDRSESKNIISLYPSRAQKMISNFEQWMVSVKQSVRGEDCKERLKESDPTPEFWWNKPEYAPYLSVWKNRPEYKKQLND